jgi:hypothetical protein
MDLRENEMQELVSNSSRDWAVVTLVCKQVVMPSHSQREGVH